MAKIKEAKKILNALGMPNAQTNSMSGMTLIALCGLDSTSPWSLAGRSARTVTKGIMEHIKKHFGINYAPNTRETFRRQVLHQFVQGRIADYNPFDPDLPTNSPRAHYAISVAALEAIKLYGTPQWNSAVSKFKREQGTLAATYEKERAYNKVPVKLPDGVRLVLSPGEHNKVQKAIIEEFIPRFAPGSNLLYLGDTSNKGLLVDSKGLSELRVPITEHDKLPDVVFYDTSRNWLFLVEAVTSHGPMTPKRIFELEILFKECKAGLIYISAFPNHNEFKKHMNRLAWETEVWIADTPDHMIHYDGDRFLGPRK